MWGTSISLADKYMKAESCTAIRLFLFTFPVKCPLVWLLVALCSQWRGGRAWRRYEWKGLPVVWLRVGQNSMRTPSASFTRRAVEWHERKRHDWSRPDYKVQAAQLIWPPPPRRRSAPSSGASLASLSAQSAIKIDPGCHLTANDLGMMGPVQDGGTAIRYNWHRVMSRGRIWVCGFCMMMTGEEVQKRAAASTAAPDAGKW